MDDKKGNDICPAHDGELIISTGRSRFETHWKNEKILWSALLGKLSASRESQETHEEYKNLVKSEQDRIKDIGGFVGGHLKDGRRKTGCVKARQVVTLDMDFAPLTLWEELMNNLELTGAMAVYSTHKHSKTSPRFRLIIPLDRQVTEDEYEAIARKVAEKIGMDWFDPTTFQATRLMYWPSHSKDVEPFFKYYDAPFLSADEVLAEYPDWMDVSYWPTAKEETQRKEKGRRQEDPTGKENLVGAFCRTYTITEAIETFLPDVYVPGTQSNRYTYRGGSTSNGLVVYDDDIFSYSNHATDPAGMQMCNAFDLVRIHRFGELDEGAREGERPSYKAMLDFVRNDDKVKRIMAKERKEKAVLDFAKETDGWEEKLQFDKRGNIMPTITNVTLILQKDQELQSIRLNELSGSIEAEKLPWSHPNKYWRDVDEAQLYSYIADTYGVEFPESKFTKALDLVADNRRFNPLRDYIEDLPAWDGMERIDRLLIDYLGAEDCPYTRAVTRKTLVGAIQRVLKPGCKHDTVLVLDGKPGIGKSTFLSKLGGAWFSDSLSLTDTRDKTAAEKLQGVWIMEIGEMQGTRKADVDILKGFISRQVDEYRAAYGRVVQRRPRTCIICGTTNSTTGFLRDTTGNRRFWPVTVNGGKKPIWDMTEEERAQIWAEALHLVKAGENNYLDAQMEKEAEKAQKEALEYDEREGQVVDYLETLLPKDWYSWDLYKRVDYFQQRDELSGVEEGILPREKVCALEIFCECFGRPRNTWKRQDGYEIAAIMARIAGWERSGVADRTTGYGFQRLYKRINATSGAQQVKK